MCCERGLSQTPRYDVLCTKCADPATKHAICCLLLKTHVWARTRRRVHLLCCLRRLHYLAWRVAEARSVLSLSRYGQATMQQRRLADPSLFVCFKN